MFKPLSNKVLVKRAEFAQKSSGGIIIPETISDKPLRGEVISVGPGKRVKEILVPMTVSVGDTVLFTKHDLIDIKIDNENFLIIEEDNIVAILEG